MNFKTLLTFLFILVSGSLFASSNNVIYTIDISTLSYDETVAVLALQGLANREQPQIMIEPKNKGGFNGLGYKAADVNVQRDGLVAIASEVTNKYDALEDVWKEFYTQKFGYTFQRVTFTELFSLFSTSFDGVVLYDVSDVNKYIPLATTIAGVKNAIPVTTSLLNKYPFLQIDTVENLIAHNFSTRLDAHRWLIENYLTQTNKDFAYSFWEAENNYFTIDFAVKQKLFSFNLSFTSSNIHANRDKIFSYDDNEAALLDQIFSYLNPGSIILGWGISDEYILQARCGSGGHALICTNASPNLSFHSSVPVTETSFKQKRQLTADDVTLEDKIYITFSMNEGDTYKSIGNLMNDGAWLHQKRGLIPFNWPINPKILQIAPALAKYYYESASDSDYFYMPTSGIGYFDAAYSTTDQRAVYAQKGKNAAEYADLHYADIWYNNFDGKEQWVKDMGMLGYTSWTSKQRVEYTKVIPIIESDLYYDLYSPPTKRKPSGMAQYIQEVTKNVSGRPWLVHVYACDPAFAAEVMANLDPTRFKAVCMDEFFQLANKAKSKLIGRYISENTTLKDEIIAETDDEKFDEEFNTVSYAWENKFCNYSIDNGELTIEPLGDNYYTLLVKSNIKFNLNKYPIIAAKINQFPTNNVKWLIKMYDGSTDTKLNGEDEYKLNSNDNIYWWDITKISSWTGIKTSNFQLVLEGTSNEELQNNIMKYDWVRAYESYEQLVSDISSSGVTQLATPTYLLNKKNFNIYVEGADITKSLKLYSITGILQRESNSNSISYSGLSSGIYLLNINNSVTLKINL